MRRSSSNVLHSAQENGYAAAQQRSLPAHTRKDTGSIPVGTTYRLPAPTSQGANGFEFTRLRPGSLVQPSRQEKVFPPAMGSLCTIMVCVLGRKRVTHRRWGPIHSAWALGTPNSTPLRQE